MADALPADDLSILDEDRLFRRVPANQLVPGDDRTVRPSSGVYKTDKLSVYAESLMSEQKRAPNECLKDYPDTYLSAIKAGSVRKFIDCPIAKDNAPPEDPAHCLIHGKKTGSFGKAMVREHEWVIAPPTQD